MARVNKKEGLARKNQVEAWLAQGASRANIIELCKKRYGITYHQVDRYIAQANESFVAESKQETAVNYGLQVRRLNNLLIRAMGDEETAIQWSVVLRILDQLNKIFGLYQPDLSLEMDWEQRLLVDIRLGVVTFELIAEAHDESLAAELFRRAGIPVETGNGNPPALGETGAVSDNGRTLPPKTT